jgi:hypothetical protein
MAVGRDKGHAMPDVDPEVARSDPRLRMSTKGHASSTRGVRKMEAGI